MECDAPFAMSGNVGRALFGGAVHIDRDLLPVPVQLFGSIGFIVDVDDCFLAFLEAQERAGKLAVVSGSGKDAIRRNLDRRIFNVQSVVGLYEFAR